MWQWILGNAVFSDTATFKPKGNMGEWERKRGRKRRELHYCLWNSNEKGWWLGWDDSNRGDEDQPYIKGRIIFQTGWGMRNKRFNIDYSCLGLNIEKVKVFSYVDF